MTGPAGPTGSNGPRLAVCIVTHDDAEDLPGCLQAVARLAGHAASARATGGAADGDRNGVEDAPARAGVDVEASGAPETLGPTRAAPSLPIDVAVVDCASADDSVARARAFAAEAPASLRLQVLPLGENRGFSGGMNAAIAATRPDEVHADDWVLTLNPDARPAPDYVERLIAGARAAEGAAPADQARPIEGTGAPRVGAATGRLVRSAPGPGGERVLDACGMYLTPAWRHHDRGSGAADRGQHARPEWVFGATGAAALFRRAALEDVAFPSTRPGQEDGSEGRWREVFDERFHTFREDAELAFRLHERGWAVLYEPAAECLHRRYNLPARRSAMPAMVNYHSLKNRYLLRAYHQTAGNALRTAPWAVGRDLAALAYVLAREHSSLAAYRWLWRHRQEIRARRRFIQSRRTAPAEAVERWFRTEAIPIDPA